MATAYLDSGLCNQVVVGLAAVGQGQQSNLDPGRHGCSGFACSCSGIGRLGMEVAWEDVAGIESVDSDAERSVAYCL